MIFWLPIHLSAETIIVAESYPSVENLLLLVLDDLKFSIVCMYGTYLFFLTLNFYKLKYWLFFFNFRKFSGTINQIFPPYCGIISYPGIPIPICWCSTSVPLMSSLSFPTNCWVKFFTLISQLTHLFSEYVLFDDQTIH